MKGVLELLFVVFSNVLFWGGLFYYVREGHKKKKQRALEILGQLKTCFKYLGNTPPMHLFEWEHNFMAMLSLPSKSLHISLTGGDDFPKKFSSKGNTNFYSPVPKIPTIQIHRKKFEAKKEGLVLYKSDIATGHQDFDEHFAIFTDAPEGFAKVVFESEKVRIAVKKLLEEHASELTLFTQKSPISITIGQDKYGSYTKEKWTSVLSLMRDVVLELPSYRAKKIAGTNFNNPYVLLIFIPIFFMIGFVSYGSIHWNIFDQDFWWKTSLTGFVFGNILAFLWKPIVYSFRRPTQGFLLLYLSLVVSMTLSTSSVLRWANAHFAKAPMIQTTARIVGKNIQKNSDSADTYYVTVAETEWTSSQKFRIRSKVYHKLETHVDITIQEGALGLYWLVNLEAINSK